jgi:hypothetical protein
VSLYCTFPVLGSLVIGVTASKTRLCHVKAEIQTLITYRVIRIKFSKLA